MGVVIRALVASNPGLVIVAALVLTVVGTWLFYVLVLKRFFMVPEYPHGEFPDNPCCHCGKNIRFGRHGIMSQWEHVNGKQLCDPSNTSGTRAQPF